MPKRLALSFLAILLLAAAVLAGASLQSMKKRGRKAPSS